MKFLAVKYVQYLFNTTINKKTSRPDVRIPKAAKWW